MSTLIHWPGALPFAFGKTIRLNDKPAIVIGVTSQNFSGLSMDNPDVWLPMNQQPYFVTGSHLFTDFSVDAHGVTMFGRLQTGMSYARSRQCCTSSIRTTFGKRRAFPALQAATRKIWAEAVMVREQRNPTKPIL